MSGIAHFFDRQHIYPKLQKSLNPIQFMAKYRIDNKLNQAQGEYKHSLTFRVRAMLP